MAKAEGQALALSLDYLYSMLEVRGKGGWLSGKGDWLRNGRPGKTLCTLASFCIHCSQGLLLQS